ncbi:hypothetical protein LOAG_09859 [Loa loa]|uniref:Uncharacterized protein n=1 Tax=Loa loa TaxID=7209 RepID=A0A1S0TSK7_LOALO|nr:hypothetical protein LOAG_09859 [Loa loa]EFO18634.1 hypothetical protein LOAG_09859 [Loa loa]
MEKGELSNFSESKEGGNDGRNIIHIGKLNYKKDFPESAAVTEISWSRERKLTNSVKFIMLQIVDVYYLLILLNRLRHLQLNSSIDEYEEENESEELDEDGIRCEEYYRRSRHRFSVHLVPSVSG